MEFEKNDNELKYIYFDSDDDFYKFCVVPNVIEIDYINPITGENCKKLGFELSNQYYDAINSGKKFVIKDHNSQIYKHKCVSYRTMSRNIQNLDVYIPSREQYHRIKYGNK